MRPEDEKSKPIGQESSQENAVSEEERAADDKAFEEGAANADETTSDAVENEEKYFDSVEPPKRKKRVRLKDMTPEQRRRYNIRALIITGTVCGLVLVFFAICALCSWVGYTGNFDYIGTIEAVDYETPFTLIDYKDSKTGYYEFVAPDEETEFRVLHLTDIHIGAGAFSAEKDKWAIQAVTETVNRVKPDLVIVTGDMAYPVPFQAGTFNNKREAEMFAALMEQLGVYWTITFGNHDTEIYSLYDRDEISAQVYMNKEKYPHCLFLEGPALGNNSDDSGKGNSVIVVRHPIAEGVEITDKESYDLNVASTKISQALVTIDSHSYTDGDYFGIAWKYDNIHQVQIDWYADEMDKLTELNGGVEVKNLVFFHIPLTEYGVYWNEYKDNGDKDTDNVKFVHGKAGEDGEKSFPGVNNCLMFETMLAHGGQGTFCGHDHYNTFALDIKAEYTDADGNTQTGAIRLSYGMSIDYLAYVGIANDIEQRGGQEIRIDADGGFATRHWVYQGDDAGKELDWQEFEGLAEFE